MTEETTKDEVLEIIENLDPAFQLLAKGAYDAHLEMRAINETLAINAGTQAQMITFAKNAALSLPVPEDVKFPTTKETRPSTMLDLATWLLEANTWAEDAIKEMGNTLLREAKVDADTSDALKDQFKVHAGVVKAYQTLAETMPGFPEDAKKVATLLGVPDRRVKNGGEKDVKHGGLVYGITRKGVKNDISSGQNSLSSSAFYYSKYFTENGEKVGVDQWRPIIKSQNPDWKQDSDPFTLKNHDGTIVVWCEKRMDEDA